MTDSTARQTIRVFLSSPGDVPAERKLALDVIEQLPYDPLLRGRIGVEVIAWDKERAGTPMLASMTPQEAINLGLAKPSECDIVVVIMWARMGTPLDETEVKPEEFRFPSDSELPDWRYFSGTEWEYINALRAAHAGGGPLVVVYRRTEPVLLDPDSPEFQDQLAQKRLVNAFFGSFRNPDGSIRHGCNEYETPDQFRGQFEHHIRELVRRVLEQRTVSPKPPPPPPPEPPEWEGSPFPGLRAFTPADAPIFFGRGRETDALIEQMRKQRFVAVVGASGSGKSSLVGAGVIPQLAENAISGERVGSKDWHVVSFTPGASEDSDPFLALADGLVRAFPGLITNPLEAGPQKRAFAAELREHPETLIDTCAALLAHAPPWAEILLFVDQFEELFTLVTDKALRVQFIKLLCIIAGAERLRVVVTVRADFYYRCVEFAELAELLRKGSFPLAAPKRDALREMIEQPAARAGLTVEPGLVERILDDTGDEPGNLALVAYTLDELYRAAQNDDGVLSHATYVSLGGVQGAIGTRAESAFAALPGDDETKARTLQRVFQALVEVDERGTATRRRASLDRLLDIDGAEALIAHFASPDVRLLVTSGDDVHAEVEVAHEALLRRWERLAAWIEATQDDHRLIRRIERDAREWDRRGRPDYMLPSAEELAELHAALDRLGVALADPLVDAFTEPEQARLLRELDDIDTPHTRRSAIGERLSAIGDTRPGVGLRPDGLPDIVWCAVPGGKIDIEGKTFTVQPCYIAKYPITYVQFQPFLDHPNGFDNDAWWAELTEKYRKQDMVEQRNKFASYPRDSVSWYQAVAYARWLTATLPEDAWPEETRTADPAPSGRGLVGRLLGGQHGNTAWSIRLPTEWEWQQAATGGDPANTYPWGPEWDGRRANTTEAGVGRATAVGMYPSGRSLLGVLDLSGNVWEWCLNEYGKPENTGLGGKAYRVLRGGAFDLPQNDARCVARYDNPPLDGHDAYGFRVVCGRPPS